jgi:hypothetical protein
MHFGRPMTDDVLQAAVPRRNHRLRCALIGGAGALAAAALVWGVAVRDRPATSLIVVPGPASTMRRPHQPGAAPAGIDNDLDGRVDSAPWTTECG